MARLFLILVISAFGQTASAGSITLTFDEFTCSGDPVFEGRQGPITYTNPNQFAYSNCGPRILVGDDGFSQKAAIRADEGTVFDVTSFDLSADYDVYRFPRAALNDAFNQTIETDGIGGFGILLEEVLFWDVGPNLELKFEADAEKLASFDYFELLGYRDGALVAEDAFDPAGVSNYAPGDAFENLDEMILGVSVSGYSTWFDDDYIYGCAIQCGSATYDNVVLQTRVAVAPVPLPATALLMGIGLLALWPLRRLRRRA
ncbi:hypothetical protein [Sulfitobacter sp. JB4-11]|uniref:hypothetical protein n=1 Tax=Sulfitobacter rhodophyticola TaxID=3238304 RepID=UPI003517B433